MKKLFKISTLVLVGCVASCNANENINMKNLYSLHTNNVTFEFINTDTNIVYVVNEILNLY
jgi:hypothetical protein